jgi:Protein of unknown function (DUF541).
LAHTTGVEAKNIQTSALAMGPEYSDEKTPKLLGYQVSQTVVLKLTDLSNQQTSLTQFLGTSDASKTQSRTGGTR